MQKNKIKNENWPMDAIQKTRQARRKKGGKGHLKGVIVFILSFIILCGIMLAIVCINNYGMQFKDIFMNFIRSKNAIFLLTTMLLLYIVTYMYYNMVNKEFLRSTKSIVLMFSILFSSIIICYTFSRFFVIYARPCMLLGLLAVVLLNKREAVFLNIIFAFMLFCIDNFTNMPTSVLSNNSLAITISPLITFTAGTFSICLMGNTNTRIKALGVSILSCLPVIVFVCSFEFTLHTAFFVKLLFAALSGIISGMFAFVLQAFFEWAFNRVTVYRLRELTDTNAPLIQELKKRAIGTFNHSIIVAYLAESCAIAINEDATLARAMAYYHDVGKMHQPEFFTENQNGRNPHDEILPELSVDIIRAHTKEGYQLLQKHGLPDAIVDATVQHHGTLPIKYFYAKAMKMTDGEVNIKEYSYNGQKPQTKLNAILMIVDASEAIARSLIDRSAARVEQVVREVIEERMQLEQFDECDITLRELNIIKQTIVDCLTGVYHDRVSYPKINLPSPATIKTADKTE